MVFAVFLLITQLSEKDQFFGKLVDKSFIIEFTAILLDDFPVTFQYFISEFIFIR